MKRIISLLLILAMLLPNLTVMAGAVEADGEMAAAENLEEVTVEETAAETVMATESVTEPVTETIILETTVTEEPTVTETTVAEIVENFDEVGLITTPAGLASSNITINGVDIGYAHGSYFTKNGQKCTSCHSDNSFKCVDSPAACNCMRYWPTGNKSTCQVDLKAVQCFGFAEYCQWKVYGKYDKAHSSSFSNLTGTISSGNCTGSNLKQKLINCAPATHVRTLSSVKGYAHSISIISTSDSGVTLTDCNHIGRCQVRYTSMTWDQLASFLKGYGGIEYSYSYKNVLHSTLKLQASVSSVNLTLGKTNSSTFYLWTTGVHTGSFKFRGSSANGRITASMGSPNTEGKYPVTVTALSSGSDTMTLKAVDVATGEVITSTNIAISITKAQYTVSYHANGGSGAPSSQTKTHGQALTLSNTKPTRTGYTFQGWSTKSTATTATYSPGSSFTIDADTTLYAIWTANPVNITASASSVSLTLGDAGSQTITVTKSGTYTGNNGRYTFRAEAEDSNIVSLSWGSTNGQSAPLTITAKNAGSTTVTISLIDYDTKEYIKSCSVSVTVNANSYTVSFNANGGSGAPASQTKYHGTNLTLTSSKPTGKVYTITFNGNGGTVVSNSKTVTKAFTGWNTKSDGTGTSYAAGGSYTANASATLYAQWENATFGGSQQPSRNGYIFDGWYASNSVNSDGKPTGQRYLSNTPITSNITLYAMWVKDDSLIYGDYDRDGIVEFADITAFNKYIKGNLTLSYSVQEFLLRGDLDRDGEITMDDIDIVNDLRLGHIGQSDLSGDYISTGISKKPQTTYQYGEAISTDGLEIALYFDGGIGYYISEGLNVTGYDPYTTGKQTLTVRFYQFTTTYDVNVTKKQHTITYYANGGNGAPSSQTKTQGSSLTLSKTIPTRFGYNFKGWSTSASDSNAIYQPGDSYTSESDLTLYAVWGTFSITNDFATTSKTPTLNYPGVGVYYKLIPAMTRPNRIYGVAQYDSIIYLYDANGKLLASDDDSGEGTQFQLDYDYTAGETYYLYVKFYNSSKVGSLKFKLAGSYRISYIDNYGVGEPEDQRKFDGFDTTLSKITPTRTGYTFKGWAVKSSDTVAAYQAGDLYTENRSINLFAVWEKEICDHICSGWAQTKAPTCTEKGVEYRECTLCDYEETRNVDAYGHTSITTAGKAATCTETGLTDGKECFICGTVTVKQESIPAKGHTEVKVNGKAATCTEAGLTEGKKCSVCGTVTVKQESIPATGVHTYENGKCKDCGAAKPAEPTEPNEPTKPSEPTEPSKPETPDAPSDMDAPVIKASNKLANGKPKITWPALEEAVRYEIYRSTTKAGTFEWLATQNGTAYTDTTAEAGKLYYYKVKAIDAEGNVSDFSNRVSRTCDLARPVVKTSNVASSGKIKLTWEKIEGAKSYKVYRATAKNGKYTLMKTVTGTTYTNANAKAGTKYFYKVIAVHENANANSAYSVIVSRMADLAQPTVTVKRNDAGKPRISWKKVDGAVKYEVWRATSKNGKYTKIATTKNLYQVNKNAKAGVTYYYKVKAVHSNTNANSAFSLPKYIKAK